MQLQGIFAPVISTFHAGSEDLDLDGFAANVRSHIAEGLDGMVVAGSTGEAALLSEAERGALVATAREHTPAGKLVIAGCGGESTRQTVARTQQAKASGADAVLVVAPHYYANAMTEEVLRAHYRRVADESPLPVILYNIPKYMHFALSAELVAELAQHGNVIGIKDSSGVLDMLKGFLKAQSPTFSVLTGSGSGLQAGLEAGARGGILAVSLFAAGFALEVLEAVRGGEPERAAKAQARLKPMADVIVAKLGVPGVKAAMEAVGKVGGMPRMPLLPLDAAGRAEVAAALAG
ncbi:dihydrodipicolinate synthase family protein [Pseudogemmatithrix spongiicola]|uniref:Dihydrodipicolinate synthase family protein n=1 Tax=Pseudogemmatithrix spongiicola TaxID=3062599 RepID=A0AA49Q9M7_9BACT|nr:dihydrodipicolinate synthase family protein [Gemmatimonadaceae bacterium 'strain 138']WKW16560.1 dihydrodipicolinate synthase family protein [Gemmatimonadaceae bacterium 'strain 318']